MFRSRCVWGLLIAAELSVGCGGPPPRPVRPMRPEIETSEAASTPAPSASVTSSDSDRAEKAGDTSTRSVDLIELDWKGLQSLIESHKGKIVVVDVWSTACEPCMKEFPHLINLHQRFPNDVTAISFDVDYAGIKNKPPTYYRERVLKFLGSQIENSVLHRMCTTAAEDLFDAIKLDSIPAVYVYGRDGALLKRFDGSTGESEGVSYEKQVIPFVGDLVQRDPAN
jgi:thiol-disulfide isomerase/thioredoxin